MTRNRKSAKDAGERFNRLIADCLADHVDDRIDKRPRTGAHDKGDITGLRHPDERLVRLKPLRVVVECKDYGGQLKVGPWLNEAETERVNDEALVGMVVAKRRGVGDPLDQTVLMTMRDLVALLTGVRPLQPPPE